VVALSAETLKTIKLYPSLLVPPSVRPALLQCWTAHRTIRGLEEDSFPIAVMISIWMSEDGLTEQDAVAILKKQQRPGVFARHEFANQLLGDLAKDAERAIEQRKKLLERERQMAEGEQPLTPLEADKARMKLASVFSGWFSQGGSSS
jgi:hypothetical protein